MRNKKLKKSVAAAIFAAKIAAATIFSSCIAKKPLSENLPAPEAIPSTFSIAAYDPRNGDLGVAVESRVLGVGAVVPWVEAGTGAIATQSYANTAYGPEGLSLLRQGKSVEEALEALTAKDSQREVRQVGIVDARGRAANFTGGGCNPWAGGRSGKNYSVQGNLLVGAETIEAMARAFEESGVEELAERLLRALEAGQRAGGDVRGRQSAAVYVARKGAGYGGNDRYIWFHVEDHPDPIAELRRILDLRLGKDPLSRASRAAAAGRLEEARAILQSAEKLEPRNPWIPFQLAALEISSGRAETAAPAIERALQTDPGFDNLYYQAAILYFQARHAEKAIEKLKRLLEINPNYRSRLRSDLGSSGHVFSENQEAIKAVKILKD